MHIFKILRKRSYSGEASWRNGYQCRFWRTHGLYGKWKAPQRTKLCLLVGGDGLDPMTVQETLNSPPEDTVERVPHLDPKETGSDGQPSRRLEWCPAPLPRFSCVTWGEDPEGSLHWTKGHIHPQTCFPWRGVKNSELMARRGEIPFGLLWRRWQRGTLGALNRFGFLPETAILITNPSASRGQPDTEPPFPVATGLCGWVMAALWEGPASPDPTWQPRWGPTWVTIAHQLPCPFLLSWNYFPACLSIQTGKTKSRLRETFEFSHTDLHCQAGLWRHLGLW